MKLKRLLLVAMLLTGSLLNGQQTVSFSYGDQHQFLGNVRISLILVGEIADEEDPMVYFLNRTNSTVDFNRFESVKVLLRIEDLNLAQFDHNFAYHLQLPLEDESYLSSQPVGLEMTTNPSTLNIGTTHQKELPSKIEIEFQPKADLIELTEGLLSVSFKIIDKKGQENLVNHGISFEYRLVPQGVDFMEDERVELTYNDTPQERDEFTAKEETFDFEEEIEVKQVSYESGNTDMSENFENYSEINETQIPSLPVKVNNNLNLIAGMNNRGEQLEILNIQNGFPAYALAFYNTNEYRQKVYTLKLGSANSFKIDLSKLPLEAGEYYLELLDQDDQKFQLPEPIVLSSIAKAGIIGLSWEWWGIILGVLIIIGTLVTIYLQRDTA